MGLEKILLTCKMNTLGFYRERYNLPEEELKIILTGRGIDYDRVRHDEIRENETIELVKKTIENHNLKYQVVREYDLNKNIVKGFDLVITLGGDGHAMNVSSYVDETKLFWAVNSDYRGSRGALTTADSRDFEKKFDMLMKGKHKIKEYTRLKAVINDNVETAVALNEIFIGNKYNIKASRFDLKYRGKEESKISSGIIIATGAGSTAYYHSATKGLKFARDAKKAKFVVLSENRPYSFFNIFKRNTRGVLKEDDILEIKSQMYDDYGSVSIDGADEGQKDKTGYKERYFSLQRGDVVKVMIAKDKPLRAIGF